MKRVIFTLLLPSLLLCLLITDHALCQSAQIKVQSDSSPLSSDAIHSAFDVLGLKVERFIYDAQFNHKVHFELLEYRKGMLQKSSNETSFSMGAGKQLFSVYLHDNAGNIEVSVESHQHRNGFAAVPLKGLNAKTWRTFESANVDHSTKAPIVGFAANRNSITSFDTSESLDVIASKYDLFVVITAQIEKK